MTLKKIVLAIAALAPLTAVAQENPTGLTFSGYGEACVTGSADGWQTPTPHLLIDAEWRLSHGWTVGAEVEYDDGLDATQLYLQKALGRGWAIRLGKMTTPIGMANLYDNPMDHFGVTLPAADEVVLPYDSNLPGLAVTASAGSWDWEVQGLLRDQRLVAVGRAHDQITDELDAGISAMYDRKVTLSADLSYVSRALTGRLIATHSWASDATHVGVEAGYNVLAAVSQSSSSLHIFARYDYLRSSADQHLYTFGVNYRPIDQIIIKADYATDFHDCRLNHCLQLGIGVSLP